MNPLAQNILENKDLNNTYEKIAEQLGRMDYEVEQCYTYESMCRISEKEKKDELVKRILKVNSKKCQNSYDLYYMINQPIEYEFSIEKEENPEFEIIEMTDRYIALLHILLMINEKAEMRDIREPMSVFKTELLKKTQKCKNKEFKEHILSLLNFEEFKISKILTEDKETETLLTAIYAAPQNKLPYIKLMKIYLEQEHTKEALEFYNNIYTSTFNTKQIKTSKSLSKFLETA